MTEENTALGELLDRIVVENIGQAGISSSTLSEAHRKHTASCAIRISKQLIDKHYSLVFRTDTAILIFIRPKTTIEDTQQWVEDTLLMATSSDDGGDLCGIVFLFWQSPSVMACGAKLYSNEGGNDLRSSLAEITARACEVETISETEMLIPKKQKEPGPYDLN